MVGDLSGKLNVLKKKKETRRKKPIQINLKLSNNYFNINNQ